MNKQLDTAVVALNRALEAKDKAEGNAVEAAAEAARIIVSDHDPRAPFEAEYKRFSALIKDAVEHCSVTLKHPRNVSQYLRQQVVVQMKPNAVIEVKRPSGKNGAVTKVAEDCKTAREVQAAFKQIREDEGASDGRSENAPARKDEGQKLAEQVARRFLEDAVFAKQLRAAMRANNYDVSLRKTPVKKTAKQVKAAPVAAEA